MAQESGVLCVLMVEDPAMAGTFVKLAGQTDTRRSLSGNPIDTSNKDDDGWGSSIAGTRNMTVTVSGVKEWPTQSVYTALENASRAGTPVNCEIVYGANGEKDAGQFYVTQNDLGGAQDGATEYSFTLQNNGQPNFTAGT